MGGFWTHSRLRVRCPCASLPRGADRDGRSPRPPECKSGHKSKLRQTVVSVSCLVDRFPCLASLPSVTKVAWWSGLLGLFSSFNAVMLLCGVCGVYASCQSLARRILFLFLLLLRLPHARLLPLFPAGRIFQKSSSIKNKRITETRAA